MDKGTKYFRTFFIISTILFAGLWGFTFLKVENQQTKLVATQHKLTETQTRLKETTYKSAQARIITVTQRCELTALDYKAAKRVDATDAPLYGKSLAGCKKQLVEVKKIAAKALH